MRLRIFVAVCAILFVYFAWRTGRPPDSSAPPSANALASQKLDILKSHPDLMPEQIAVLLMTADQEAMPISHVLDPAGVPFTVCLDTSTAFSHRVVFIPFADTPVRMTEELRAALQVFVSSGGTLVLQTPPENTWSWLTGLETVAANRKRKKLAFQIKDDPIFVHLTEPEQQSIVIASRGTVDGVWTSGLKPLGETGAEVIAIFPDTGEGAIVRRPMGTGAVYTFGVDLRDMVVRPQAERHFDAGRSAYDGFEPAADVWPLIWRGLYEHAAPFWVRLRSAPGQGPFWLMTHDLGPGADLSTARDFAAADSSAAVAATWFIQTRTGSEENDAPFFDNKVRSLMTELSLKGDEIASHGVSHGSNFADLPLGGAEKTAEYKPTTNEDGEAEEATLVGETRVSKLLLESALSSYTVAGFRGPSMAYPPALDAVLEESGYGYDSSLGANACLTHFPFRMVKGRAMVGASRIVEFPITFTDEVPEGKMPEVPAMLDVARRISSYDGVVVWDVRPGQGPAPRARLHAVLSGAPAGTTWMTMGEAARFWSRRHKTQFSFRAGSSQAQKVLRIQSPSGVAGLSFEVSGPVKECSSEIQVTCSGKTVSVGSSVTATEAEIRLTLE